MTDPTELIARVEAALEGVTPGPWRVGPVDDCRVEDANGNEVAQIDGDYNQPETWPLMEANARFIAAARQDVPDLLAWLKAVMAERDASRKAEKSANAAFDIGKSFQDLVVKERDLARYQLAKAQAEAAALRARVADQTEARLEAYDRRHMNAPEDPHVEALCLRYGYGAVMDAASRLWARGDSVGAFYIGGCIGLRDDAEAAALRAKAKEAGDVTNKE